MGCSQVSAAAAHAGGEGELEVSGAASGGAARGSGGATPASSSGGNAVASMGPSDSFVRAACALQLQGLLRQHPFLEPQGCFQAHPLHLWVERCREGYANNKFKAAQEDLRRLRSGLEAESRHLTEVFRRFDGDASGHLDDSEFRHMCAYLAWGGEQADLLDLDGDGKVMLGDFQAFVGHLGGVQQLLERRRLRASASRQDVCNYAGIVVGSRVRAHYYVHRQKSKTWKEARVIAVNMEYRMAGPGAMSLGVLLEFRFGHGGKGGRGWIARQVVPMSWVLSGVEDASVAAALREVGILDDHQAFWALLLPDSEMQALATLEPCQRNALSWVRTHSSESHTKALPKVLERFKKLGYTEQDLQTVLDWVQDLAPVIVHLSLDAMGKFMESDEFYRNQFETKTSFGCLDNSTRHGWEHDLFGGAYDEAKPFERCKYGVLNVMNDYNGVVPARQYGDSYLVLKDVRLRLTFASTDSGGISGKRLAVLDHYAHVLQEYNDRELQSLVCVAKGAIAPDEERGGRSDGTAQLKLLRGKTEDPTKEWITVGFPGLEQRAGRFFFEVHLQVDCSAPQVGCLSPGFARAIGTSTAQGVGDDNEGWAVDGLNSARWHSGNPKAWATWWPAKKDRTGERVLSKDLVVGIAVDLDERKIFSATDGAWEEAPVFTADDIPRGTALYPALSVKGRAAFVFGPTFKHPPPDSAGAFAQWPGTFGGLVRVDCPHIGDSEGLGMYKEIQIHGALCLKEHVQRLVAAEKYREKPKAQRSFVLRVLNGGACTGSYERAGAHDGMPLYKSASNGIIYFHKQSGAWRMSETEDFQSFRCSAPATGGPTSEPPRTGWEVPDEQHGVLPAAAVERALATSGLGSEDVAGMLQALKKKDETSGDLLVYRKLAGRSLAEECTRLGGKLGELESPDKLWEVAADEWRQLLLRDAGLERGQVLETGHPYEAKRTTWKREVSFEGASALTVHFSSRCSTYDSKAAFKIYAGGLLRNNAGAGARVEIKGLDGGSHTVCGTVVERKPAGVGPWVVQLDRHESVEDPSAGSGFRPAVGDVVEALHKSGGWHKAKVAEVIFAVDWYDAVREPKTIIVKWLAGGFSDDCEKTLVQIRRPQAAKPGSKVIEAMPRYGKVPTDGERCLATCLEKPNPVKVTYKGGAKVGDEITGFTLDRTCPLAPISIAGFSGEGPAQASGVEAGWYLDLVATSLQGSSKERLRGLLEGIGGVPPAGGTSAKAKNNHLNKLLDASFADLEELLPRLNEGLRDMTDVTLAFTKSCSSQTVTLLPEAFAIYTGGQKVGGEVKEFSTAGATVSPAAFVAPGPAQEAGVRDDWVLDVARTIKESCKTGKEAANVPSSGGPLPELVEGVWSSDKGGCRILRDASTGKLSYEEELPEGGGLLHGDLVWQGPPGECWEASLQLRKPADAEGEGAEPTESAEPEATVGKIRAAASRAAPLSLVTRIHVDGEDLEWHPPVAWQRDLAKDPNSLLPLSGVTLVFRQPRPTKSEVFKGSGASQDGQRWTCRELPGSSADFEFSTDGDGADHPERRWGAWALVLPKEAPPPDVAALDALADRWAESLAKASGVKESPQVERDGWDEQRLRALCARHGWEFEWMTEDGERRRQVDERHRLGGGRVDLAGVRKVALERQKQTAEAIAKESSVEAETGAPPDEPAQDRPKLEMKRSASGFNVQS